VVLRLKKEVAVCPFWWTATSFRLKPWRGGAKRRKRYEVEEGRSLEKRWLAFIEVRVSHLFSHGWHS
jgi:hypothetical protein